jgi:hypothetical protein
MAPNRCAERADRRRRRLAADRTVVRVW